MPELLSDKVCIITGAGKGIGRSIATVFNEHGAKLALITRTEADFVSLKAELNMDDSNLLTHCGDVSDPAVIEEFIANVIQKFGRIDVLVNNAGMRFRKDFLDISLQEMKQVLDVNLISVFLLCQAVIPHMLKNANQNTAKIINMSSIAGTLGLPYLSAYVTSKAAILGLTKSLALEFAENNIQVNAIAPGFAKTSYYDDFKEQRSELHDFTIERTPMRRWAESHEIANTCLYLASGLSDYVTGETLTVDGGWSAW